MIDAGFAVPDEVHDGFAQITTMAVSPAGTVAVLDAISAQVTVLDARGRLVRRVGRAGRGPGELSARLVQSVTFSGDGTLWVPQASQRRIDRFADDGRVLSALPFGLPLPTAFRAVWQPGDRLAYWTVTATGDFTVALYDTRAEQVTWSVPVIARDKNAAPGPRMRALAPAVAWCAAPDGSVYFGRSDSATVRVRRPDGAVATFVTMDVPQRALSAADAQTLRALEDARRRALLPAPPNLPPLELPASLPRYAGLLCGRDGSVWRQDFPPVGALDAESMGALSYTAAPSPDWVRYRPDGSVAERVRIPARVVVHAADAEALYGVRMQDDGDQRVVRLVWGR